MEDRVELGSAIETLEVAGVPEEEEPADSLEVPGTWTWLIGVLVVCSATEVVALAVPAAPDAELEPDPLTKYFSRIGR